MRSPIADRVVSLFLFHLSDSELLYRFLWTLDNGNVRLRYSFLELHLLLLEKAVVSRQFQSLLEIQIQRGRDRRTLPGSFARLYTGLPRLFLVFSLTASAKSKWSTNSFSKTALEAGVVRRFLGVILR